MKKIKVSAALLIITLVMTTSFSTHHTPKAAVLYNFEFTGYDMMEPGDWTLITVPEPTCNYASGNICYIRAEKDPDGPHPAHSSLVDLSNNSTFFTAAYTGVYGKVRLKP